MNGTGKSPRMSSLEESEESVPTDYEIAQSVEKSHVADVVAPYGLERGDLDLFGEHKAKVKLPAIERIREEREATADR